MPVRNIVNCISVFSILVILSGCYQAQRGEQSSNDCIVDGVRYTPGSTGIPASDGCNTCTCIEGADLTCTAMECPVPDDGSCVVDGVRYPPGTTNIPASDGCNTCECIEGENLACTAMECPVPDDGSCVVDGVTYPNGSNEVPDSDGCNYCLCVDGEISGCTMMECPNVAFLCEDHPWPETDPFEITGASIDGDDVLVEVEYGGGCEDHQFDLCFEPDIMTSDPLQVQVWMTHDANGDICRALIMAEVRISLLPLREYVGEHAGAIRLWLGDERILYEW